LVRIRPARPLLRRTNPGCAILRPSAPESTCTSSASGHGTEETMTATTDEREGVPADEVVPPSEPPADPSLEIPWRDSSSDLAQGLDLEEVPLDSVLDIFRPVEPE
jgi:hypothetical protein